MSYRRTISLILGLMMVIVTMPTPALAGGCATEMASTGGCCCCGSDRDASDDERGCAMATSTTLACCDEKTPAPSASSLPATRSTCTELYPTIALLVILDRPAMLPARYGEDLPDVFAAERQRTYLHVSSLLI